MNITKRAIVLMLLVSMLAPVRETKPITTAAAVGAGFGAAAGAAILGLIIYKGVKHSRCRRYGGDDCLSHHERRNLRKQRRQEQASQEVAQQRNVTQQKVAG